MPEEIRKAKTETITFGGQEFVVNHGQGKKQTVVATKRTTPRITPPKSRPNFPEGWHERLAKAFDKYLVAHDADALNKGNMLFDLYKAWRDQCKVGLSNRVDLEN